MQRSRFTDQENASHNRSYGREEEVLEPHHYRRSC